MGRDILKNTFDEKGRVLRRIDTNGTTLFTYYGDKRSDHYTQKDYEIPYEENLKSKLAEAEKSPDAKEDRNSLAFALATLYIAQGRPQPDVDVLMKLIDDNKMIEQLKKQPKP